MPFEHLQDSWCSDEAGNGGGKTGGVTSRVAQPSSEGDVGHCELKEHRHCDGVGHVHGGGGGLLHLIHPRSICAVAVLLMVAVPFVVDLLQRIGRVGRNIVKGVELWKSYCLQVVAV